MSTTTPPPVTLRSEGAARTVTGSLHLLDLAGERIAVDCGAFQGTAALEARNAEPFGFAPDALRAVLLTHAHLDHVGRLPSLIRAGFRGPVYCTPETAAIARVVLLDSARVQHDAFVRAYRRARRGGTEGDVPLPPYAESDVRAALAQLRPTVRPGEPFLVGNARVTARAAGHVLGSVWYEVRAAGVTVVCSGDLGGRFSTLQPPFALPGACDAVLVEGTYADRLHRPMEDTLSEFRDVLRRSVAAGGRVLVPTFAVERAQVLLYHLKRLMDAGEVPRVPVYLDSPMAARITGLYRRSAAAFVPSVRAALEAGEAVFTPDTLRVVSSPAESRALNDRAGPAVILAGSGMMNGGRIQHHLKHQLWRPETSVVIVSFQAPGTLGAALVAGARSVHVLGEEVAVRASVHTIGGFSAHADQADLLAWLEPTGAARVLLVHGEDAVLGAFEAKLRGLGRTVTVMERGQPVTLTGTA